MADDSHYDIDEYGMSYRKNPPRARKKSRYFEDYYEQTSQYRPRESPRVFSPIRPLQPDDPHRARRAPKPGVGTPMGWRGMYANPERRNSQTASSERKRLPDMSPRKLP
nr:unnamed protein product [Spirometra erinaceieuropaei]